MRDLSNELEEKKIDIQKLLNYGFLKCEKSYLYKKDLCNSSFQMIVQIKGQTMFSKVIDLESKEEFLLVDVKDAKGEFVGKIKEEYEEVLEDIFSTCFFLNVFKQKQAQEVISYIKNKYKDELEFLWEKFDKNAIVRNKENKKWYGVFLTIPALKLGIKSDKMIEILDVRCEKEKIEDVLALKHIYPGYHMNKKSWITIVLDGSLNNIEVFSFIDQSYHLSLKK